MNRRTPYMTYIKAGVAILGIAAVIAVCLSIYNAYRHSEISIGADKVIDVTPEEIAQIKDIGQWEFLSVVDEVIVDTVKHNLIMPDDRLTCVYYGRVSLGIDIKNAAADWVVNNNDTLFITLPQPKILDPRFIDEARTRVFYERGRWSPEAKEQMYRRARRQMAQTAMTPENITAVRNNAVRRFDALFRAIGAKDVRIEFEQDDGPRFNLY